MAKKMYKSGNIIGKSPGSDLTSRLYQPSYSHVADPDTLKKVADELGKSVYQSYDSFDDFYENHDVTDSKVREAACNRFYSENAVNAFSANKKGLSIKGVIMAMGPTVAGNVASFFSKIPFKGFRDFGQNISDELKSQNKGNMIRDFSPELAAREKCALIERTYMLLNNNISDVEKAGYMAAYEKADAMIDAHCSLVGIGKSEVGRAMEAVKQIRCEKNPELNSCYMRERGTDDFVVNNDRSGSVSWDFSTYVQTALVNIQNIYNHGNMYTNDENKAADSDAAKHLEAFHQGTILAMQSYADGRIVRPKDPYVNRYYQDACGFLASHDGNDNACKILLEKDRNGVLEFQDTMSGQYAKMASIGLFKPLLEKTSSKMQNDFIVGKANVFFDDGSDRLRNSMKESAMVVYGASYEPKENRFGVFEKAVAEHDAVTAVDSYMSYVDTLKNDNLHDKEIFKNITKNFTENELSYLNKIAANSGLTRENAYKQGYSGVGANGDNMMGIGLLDIGRVSPGVAYNSGVAYNVRDAVTSMEASHLEIDGEKTNIPLFTDKDGDSWHIEKSVPESSLNIDRSRLRDIYMKGPTAAGISRIADVFDIQSRSFTDADKARYKGSMQAIKDFVDFDFKKGSVVSDTLNLQKLGDDMTGWANAVSDDRRHDFENSLKDNPMLRVFAFAVSSENSRDYMSVLNKFADKVFSSNNANKAVSSNKNIDDLNSIDAISVEDDASYNKYL